MRLILALLSFPFTYLLKFSPMEQKIWRSSGSRMALGGPGWTPRRCLLGVCPDFSWPLSLFASPQLRHGLRVSSTIFFFIQSWLRQAPLSRAMVRSMGTVGLSGGNSSFSSTMVTFILSFSICQLPIMIIWHK